VYQRLPAIGGRRERKQKRKHDEQRARNPHSARRVLQHDRQRASAEQQRIQQPVGIWIGRRVAAAVAVDQEHVTDKDRKAGQQRQRQARKVGGDGGDGKERQEKDSTHQEQVEQQ